MDNIYLVVETCGCGQEYSCVSGLKEDHITSDLFFINKQEAEEHERMLREEHPKSQLRVISISLANLPMLKKRFALRKLTSEERDLLKLPNPDSLKV